MHPAFDPPPSILLNLDWLQLSFKGEPHQLPIGYEFVPLEGGNKIFSHLCTIKYHDVEIATVQYAPVSDVVARDLLTWKFHNVTLYNGMWRAIYCDLLDIFQWAFVGFTRVDICGDFVALNNGLSPEVFITRLFLGEYVKFNRRAEVFFGADKRQIVNMFPTQHLGLAAYMAYQVHQNISKITGYRAGSRASAVCVYMYNKSLELRTQTDKPYIRQMWHDAGLAVNDDTEVWRLEFSIKGKAWREIEPDAFRAGDYIHTLWHSLVSQSFIIKDKAGAVVDVVPSTPVECPPPSHQRESNATRSARLLISRLCKEAASSPSDVAAEIVNTVLLIAAQRDVMQYAELKLRQYHLFSQFLE